MKLNQIEIRRIENVDHIDCPNSPFDLFGRLVPVFDGKEWTCEEELWPENECSSMCFPQEDYNPSESNMIFLGAFAKEKCIGYIVLEDYYFHYMYVNDLEIAEEYRRMGVATVLLKRAMQTAVEKKYGGLYLVCQDNNLAACRFYRKNGFVIGGFDNRVYQGTSQEGKADIHFYKDASVDNTATLART